MKAVECNFQNHPATEIECFGGAIIAGGRESIRKVEWLDLIVDLTGGKPLEPRIRLSRGLERFFPSIIRPKRPDYLSIDWPDMGVTIFDPEVYRDLQRYLPGKRVGVHCQAGHGRTGTFLCALLGGLGMKEQTLSFLREVYCDRAVESHDQLKYLRSIGLASESDDTPVHKASAAWSHVKPPVLPEDVWESFVEFPGTNERECSLEQGPCQYHYSGGDQSQHCGSDTYKLSGGKKGKKG